MIKRTADWLEKTSAGAFLIGLFQENNLAIIFGLGAFILSGVLTWLIDRRAKQ
jgi:hypothetical protein